MKFSLFVQVEHCRVGSIYVRGKISEWREFESHPALHIRSGSDICRTANIPYARVA